MHQKNRLRGALLIRDTDKNQIRDVQGLVVFDLDNTLIDVSSSHRLGYRTALRKAYGLNETRFEKAYKGNPQPLTLRMMCEKQGLSGATIDEHFSEAVRILSETTVAHLDEDLRSALLPRVPVLLHALQERGYMLGLVTGTVSTTAYTILARAQIDDCFSVGAFGEERANRPQLLQLALRRAEQMCSPQQALKHLTVIGDSPRDIHAGRSVDARVVAVATGAHTVEDLRSHGPDWVLPDFSNLALTLKAILDKNK